MLSKLTLLIEYKYGDVFDQQYRMHIKTLHTAMWHAEVLAKKNTS